MPTMLKSLLRQEERFMLSHPRILLLILFLGIGTLEFFITPATVAASEGSQQWSETTHSLDQVGQHALKYVVLSMLLERLLTCLFKAEELFASLLGKIGKKLVTIGFGLKTPVAIGLGVLLAWGLNLDISCEVLNAVQTGGCGSKPGKELGLWHVIDGLLLAGGNDGVYRLLAKFGINKRFI